MQTGFYNLIKNKLGSDYEETLDKFNGNVGFLGKMLMQSLLNNNGDKHDKN